MDLRIEIVGEKVICKQDGREAVSAPLADFLAALVGRSDHLSLPNAIPDGVCFIRCRGDVVVLVIQDRPQVHTVRWLADDSPVPLGRGAVYRTARLSFPFVLIIVAFRGGGMTGYQQCFYRTSPLQDLADPLLLPNLYNVADGHGMKCWLCLASLRKNLVPLSWEEKVREIRKHLWGAGFNKSSEIHEGMSYWQVMQGIDPRVKSLTAWEQESRKDEFFPLKVKWQPAGKSVGEVMEEMLSALFPARFPASVAELAQLLSLYPKSGNRRKALPLFAAFGGIDDSRLF